MPSTHTTTHVPRPPKGKDYQEEPPTEGRRVRRNRRLAPSVPKPLLNGLTNYTFLDRGESRRGGRRRDLGRPTSLVLERSRGPPRVEVILTRCTRVVFSWSTSLSTLLLLGSHVNRTPNDSTPGVSFLLIQPPCGRGLGTVRCLPGHPYFTVKPKT